MKYAVLSFFSLLFFFACQSPSDQILKEFIKVNESLKKSGNVANSQYQAVYDSIQLDKEKDPTLALHADTLYHATESAIEYIEQLKHQLLEKDSAGLKTGPAADLLHHSAVSDTLKTKLIAVADDARTAFVGKELIMGLDVPLQDIDRLRTDNEWTDVYFGKTPTVAALTILSSFQMDCRQAALTAFYSMRRHLRTLH